MDLKNKLLIFAFIICTVILAGICCHAAPPRDDYKLVLADEFDGSALDTEIWGYRSGDKNKKENVRVANGSLLIDYTCEEVQKEDQTTDCKFWGGGVITNNTLGYGYYEVRAKVFSGVNGLHTSFWTSGYGYGALSPKPAYKPEENCFMEIDMFEVNSREDGENPAVAQCLHYFVGEHEVGYSGNRNDFDCSADWFIMGMEW